MDNLRFKHLSLEDGVVDVESLERKYIFLPKFTPKTKMVVTIFVLLLLFLVKRYLDFLA